MKTLLRLTTLSLCLLSLFALPAEARHSHHHQGGGGSTNVNVSGAFDYYLLSLSWSPNYCVTHSSDTAQCGKGFGFVLHGLWPQYFRGGYPQDCSTTQTLSTEAIDFGKTIFPSPKLISHEWDKHGTCSALDALSYFKQADQARTAIKIPAAFEAPQSAQVMSVADVLSAFTVANPSLTEKSLAVVCTGSNFSELRVCLNKDLSPAPCGQDVKNQCSGSVRVRSVR